MMSNSSTPLVESLNDLNTTSVLDTINALDTIIALVETLLRERDQLAAERASIAALLKTFYEAGASISSLQPVLDLAVALNPELLPASWRRFAHEK